MPITEGSVKLIKSETMSDEDFGGGRMAKVSTNEVVDGASNSMFPDISELDRTYGRISLRKVFPAVLTTTVDTYYGAHAFISEVPKDPRVSTVLFSTKSWTDYRENAQNKIEQYLAPAGKWPGFIYETQLEGARAIQIVLKPDETLPSVGKTLYLVMDEGSAGQVYQYVRVTKVEAVSKTFTSASGAKWLAMVVTITLSDPLRYTFVGIAPTPVEADMSLARAKMRDTIVADASKYYSTVPMIQNAALGDFSAKASTIYGQLVPSAQTEVALVDLDTAGQTSPVIQSGDNKVSYTIAYAFGNNKSLYFGTGVFPGSLKITNGSTIITDAKGLVYAGGVQIGVIEYSTGVITFTAGNYTGTSSIEFYPASAPIRVMQSAALVVGDGDRGYIWTINLNPPPPPQSLKASYRAQGKWYDLVDTGPAASGSGVGAIAGSDASLGTGSVNYSTGSVVLTLGALPDADSEILFFWATKSNFFNRSSRAVSRPYYKFQLANKGIIPGTCHISWPNPAAAGTLTVTDDGKGNFSSADGFGTIRYQTGEIRFSPALVPLGGSTFSFDYAWGNKSEKVFTTPSRDGSGNLDLTIPGGNLLPGSLEVSFTFSYQDYTLYGTAPPEMQSMTSSNGVNTTTTLQDVPSSATVGALANRSGSFIDYTAGEIKFNPDGLVKLPIPKYSSAFVGFQATIINAGARRHTYVTNYGG